MLFYHLLPVFLGLLIPMLWPVQSTVLSELVPEEAWERTGISTLSESQQQALAEEIGTLLERCFEAVESGAAVIAPSVSTSMKANEILREANILKVSLRQANRVLVVVRSSLYYPLMPGYDCVCELKEDAEWQLNISGPQFHIYIYSMADDLSVMELSHKSFDADVW